MQHHTTCRAARLVGRGNGRWISTVLKQNIRSGTELLKKEINKNSNYIESTTALPNIGDKISRSISSSVSSRSEDGSDDSFSYLHISIHELVSYYEDINTCMQGYDHDGFYLSLKSCLPIQRVYIHNADPSRSISETGPYYSVSTRYPYSNIRQYLQNIPEAYINKILGIGEKDYIIICIILTFSTIGCLVSLWKISSFGRDRKVLGVRDGNNSYKSVVSGDELSFSDDE